MSAPYTTARDKLANHGMDQELIPRMLYSTGDGDQALIARRGQYRFEAEKSEYVMGDTIRIDIGSTLFALDVARSKLHFDLALTWTGTWDPKLDFGFCGNGIDPKYHVLEYLGVADTTHDSKLTADFVSPSGVNITSRVKEGDLVYFAFDDQYRVISDIDIAVGEFSWVGALATGHATDEVFRVNVEASIANMLRNGHVENLFSKLRVLTKKGSVLEEIDNYADIARLIRINTMSEEEKMAKGHPEGVGVVPQSTNQYTMNTGIYHHYNCSLDASGFFGSEKFQPVYQLEGIRIELVLAPLLEAFQWTTASLTQCTLKNVAYEAEMVEFSAGIKSRVASALGQGGIPIVIPTWNTTTFTPGISNGFTLRIHEHFTHATMAAVKFRSYSGSVAKQDDSFGHVNPRIYQYQWKLGTQTMPDQRKQVDTSTDAYKLYPWLYNQVQRAWGNDSGKSNSVGNFQKFIDVTARDNLTRPGRCEFSLATVLQTSPGIEGSAMIIGDAADLQLQLKIEDVLAADQEVLVHILYDRLVTIRPGGTVEVNF